MLSCNAIFHVLQVHLLADAVALQRDRLLACQLQPELGDIATAEDKAERFLHHSLATRLREAERTSCKQMSDTAPMRLICAAISNLDGPEAHLQWLAVLLSNEGEMTAMKHESSKSEAVLAQAEDAQ